MLLEHEAAPSHNTRLDVLRADSLYYDQVENTILR